MPVKGLKYFKIILKLLLPVALCIHLNASAQDALFSQSNMSPLHYNPAFTGNTYAPLIHINSRVQWPSVSWAYNTIGASYDQYFKRYNSGLGIYLMNDIAGNGIYINSRLEGLYSYSLRIKDNNFIKLGLSFAMVQNRLNWDKLVFYDQLDSDYGYFDELGDPNISAENRPDKLSIIYPDLAVGVMYYSEIFYAGFSLKHANNPEASFLPKSSNADNGLSGRYSLQFGAQIPLGKKYTTKRQFVHPSVIYSKQANLEYLNIQGILDIGTIYAGIGYRHAFDNPDAVLITAGIEIGMYTIGYSYDLTVSGLSVNTGGSHELGIRLNFDKSEWFEEPFRYSDCFEIFR